MLGSKEIKKLIAEGEIAISPFKEENLGPNSYDLTISGAVKILANEQMPFGLSQDTFAYTKKFLPCVLKGFETLVFSTEEIVGCKSCTLGLLSARSNLSRTGLVFQFSSLLDTGFKGVLSGAIINPTPQCFTIPAGLRPLQIMFDYAEGGCERLYGERKSSKNTAQLSHRDVAFKPDVEFKIVLCEDCGHPAHEKDCAAQVECEDGDHTHMMECGCCHRNGEKI